VCRVSDTFLTDRRGLRGADAVAALLVLEDGRYVLQLRDDVEGIFYPGHWGCFGGAVDRGEAPREALRRELKEELEFEAAEFREFTRFDFDFRPLGQAAVFRIYYEVPLSPSAYSRLVLHEGAEVRAFGGAEILAQPRVTPYDAFALFLHYRRQRFQP
jgi:8-oxo-dGTP pyrophosphatase MutT (NUDIX family)